MVTCRPSLQRVNLVRNFEKYMNREHTFFLGGKKKALNNSNDDVAGKHNFV